MSNAAVRQAERQRARHRHVIYALAGIVAVGAATAGAVVAARSSSGAGATVQPRELNAMGMPVVANRGVPSGTASLGALVAEPAAWDLGQVGLNVAVRPTWQLKNTGTETLTVGEPHVQINKGCCPGPFTWDGSNDLAGGASTNLSFELSMHPGMDGPHDMTLHVPVEHADGTSETLTLSVTGNFHD